MEPLWLDKYGSCTKKHLQPLLSLILRNNKDACLVVLHQKQQLLLSFKRFGSYLANDFVGGARDANKQ